MKWGKLQEIRNTLGNSSNKSMSVHGGAVILMELLEVLELRTGVGWGSSETGEYLLYTRAFL